MSKKPRKTAHSPKDAPARPPAPSRSPVGLPAWLLNLPPWVLAAFAVLAMAAVYARVSGFGFVNLDDNMYVTENPRVLAGLTLDSVRWALAFNSTNYWQPLTWLSLMLDQSLYGGWAGGFHLTNVALHGANVALLFFLVLRWLAPLAGAGKWVALAVALVFGLHPVHVESVAWVTERKDVLFMLFGLLCLRSYTIYVQGPDRGRFKALLPSLLAYAASLSSKPMLVTLPALLLVLDFWPLGRFRAAGEQSAPARPGLPGLLLEKLPFLLLAAAAAATSLFTHPASYDGIDPDLGLKLANALASYLDYLRLLVFPTGLAVYYPYPLAVSPLKLAGAVALLLVVSAGTIWQVRRRPYLLACWLWFLGTLAPVLVPPKVGMHVAHADRWAYFPSLGLYLGLALLAREALGALGDIRLRQRLAAAVLAGLCVLPAALTSLQLGAWKDQFTLYERALAVTEDNYFIMNNYGVIKMRAGDFETAEKWLRRSVTTLPGYSKAQGNLGVLYANMRRYEQALPWFELSLQNEREAEIIQDTWYQMGYCLAQLGRYDEAEADYRKALTYRNDHPQTWNDLGSIAMARGQTRLAEEYYAKAVSLDPGYAVGRENLARARALLAAGR